MTRVCVGVSSYSNNINESCNATVLVTCTIHTGSTADQCVVTVADDRVNQTGKM